MPPECPPVDRQYFRPAATAIVEAHDEWDTDWVSVRPFVPPSRVPLASVRTETDEATAVEAASPWYAKAVKRVAHLGHLGDKWADDEVAPPNEIAATSARDVLEILESRGIEPSHIGASTDEGICISFERGERYADVECYNSGEILAVTAEHGTSPDVWTVSDSGAGLRQAIDRIGRFIAQA